MEAHEYSMLPGKFDEDETTWAEAFGKETDVLWLCETSMIIGYFI